jgi:hypothetical protein
MNKIFLLFFVLLLFGYNSSKSQDIHVICEQALDKIKEKDYQGFKTMFYTETFIGVNDRQLLKLINKAAGLIDKYGLPSKEMVLKRLMTNITKDGPKIIIYLDYPFPSPKEKHIQPERTISFGFIQKNGMDKISTFEIRNLVDSDN